MKIVKKIIFVLISVAIVMMATLWISAEEPTDPDPGQNEPETVENEPQYTTLTLNNIPFIVRVDESEDAISFVFEDFYSKAALVEGQYTQIDTILFPYEKYDVYSIENNYDKLFYMNLLVMFEHRQIWDIFHVKEDVDSVTLSDTAIQRLLEHRAEVYQVDKHRTYLVGEFSTGEQSLIGDFKQNSTYVIVETAYDQEVMTEEAFVSKETCTEGAKYLRQNQYGILSDKSEYFYGTSPQGHQWERIELIKEATCQEAGMGKYKCSVCGEIKEETIPLLSHSYTTYLSKLPTGDNYGEVTYKCMYCEDSFVTQIPKISLKTNLQGHLVTKAGEEQTKNNGINLDTKTIALIAWSAFSLIVAVVLFVIWKGRKKRG